ncbi:MAG TPA: Na(+)/H(+) antiporter subunit F1 [Candidatus Avamphibacillus intestinigallinarum]|nr:Na(+)/H(+) antiporter subunit F1 [Candidatus Avamphibacillus intestinigallinarum]
MLHLMLTVALIFFTLTIGIGLFRIIRGPSTPDRVVALDMIGVNLLSAIATVSVLFTTQVFLEAILILGLLAFISTIALSKFIDRGVIVEYKRDR